MISGNGASRRLGLFGRRESLRTFSKILNLPYGAVMSDKTFSATLDAVAEVMRAKAELPFFRLLTLAALGGAYIALAAFGATAVSCNLTASPDTYGLGRFVSGVVFPIGLMLVVVGGAELFTGNCLMTEALRRGVVRPSGMARNWILTYLGNMIGAFAVAAMLHASGLFHAADGRLAAAVIRAAAAKISLGSSEAFTLGVLCNWLVCLAVWLSSRTDVLAHKALLVFFPICLFVISGYEHSVANMYYLSAGFWAATDGATLAIAGLPEAAVSAISAIGASHNLLFVTLGNIVGGALFVGGAYAVAYKTR